MRTFAIGDVQGCFDPLIKLLHKINFDENNDQLWFVGDVVNRGPKSLDTLRFIKNLPHKQIVLGNHDLHLLAVYFGVRKTYADDTIQEIITAPDSNELINWLCQQPLFFYDKTLGYAMVHAGLAPMWTLEKALALSDEVSQALQSKNRKEYLQNMYGNTPALWSDDLEGFSRLRVITNYLTRMRYCDQAGQLDLKTKDLECPDHFYPWFLAPGRKTENQNIIFGHWAALNGKADHPHIFALDTGIVWGRELTAMNLKTQERITI